MKRTAAILVALTVCLAGLLAASAGTAASAPQKVTITLVTHDSFAVSKSVLAAFTKRTGVTVKILQSGDAGAALNQVILTKDHPLGDVFFGVDNTFLGRALDAGIFRVHTAVGLDQVPAEYQLDGLHTLTPVDHGDVCINYDKKWFAKRGLAVPTTLDDLTKPAYKGLLAVEDPATSSPGLAFTLATIARYGASGWRDYWAKLRSNDVLVDDGWESAYEGDFTQGGNKGTRPLVVSYASSPAAAVYYSKPQLETSPVGTMLDSCFRQVEFVGVLQGTKHQHAADQLVDFMLSPKFQADVPLQMFVFPVRSGVPLPKVFEQFADVSPNPLTLAPDQIGRHRDEWIQQWRATVLG
jgi:thiamine transport system substrate-binding protein